MQVQLSFLYTDWSNENLNNRRTITRRVYKTVSIYRNYTKFCLLFYVELLIIKKKKKS